MPEIPRRNTPELIVKGEASKTNWDEIVTIVTAHEQYLRQGISRESPRETQLSCWKEIVERLLLELELQFQSYRGKVNLPSVSQIELSKSSLVRIILNQDFLDQALFLAHCKEKGVSVSAGRKEKLINTILEKLLRVASDWGFRMLRPGGFTASGVIYIKPKK